MKKRFAAAILCSVASASVASASVFYEPFNYATGPLAGNTNATSNPNWTDGVSIYTLGYVWSHAGTQANDTAVIGGSLSYPGLATSNDPNSNMANMFDVSHTDFDRIQVNQEYGTGSGGPVVYYSMLMKVSNMTGMIATGANGGFFAGLQYYPDSNGGMDYSSLGGGPFGATLCLRLPRDSSGNLLTQYKDTTTGVWSAYQVGIAFRDAPAGTTRIWDTDTLFGTSDTLFSVVKFDMGDPNASDDDSATLWIYRDDGTTADAIPLTEPGTFTLQSANSSGSGANDLFWPGTGTPGTPADTNVRSFVLRGGNTFVPNGLDADEVRVGSTWADVTATPEPATLSLLGLGALGLLGRRRRKA
jgi:hypothetical protein